MIKVTFKKETSAYWVICERAHESNTPGSYVLNSVMEDSMGMGPFSSMQTTAGWKIVTVEEV